MKVIPIYQFLPSSKWITSTVNLMRSANLKNCQEKKEPMPSQDKKTEKV